LTGPVRTAGVGFVAVGGGQERETADSIPFDELRVGNDSQKGKGNRNYKCDGYGNCKYSGPLLRSRMTKSRVRGGGSMGGVGTLHPTHVA
jgi:hypothetical protein